MPRFFSKNYVHPATSANETVISIRPGLKVYYPGNSGEDKLKIKDWHQTTRDERNRPTSPELHFTYSEIRDAEFSGKHPRNKEIGDLRQDLLYYIKMRAEPGSATWFGDNRFAKLEQASKLLKLVDDNRNLIALQRTLKQIDNQELSEKEKEDLYTNYFNLHKRAPGENMTRSIGGNLFLAGMLSELALEISLRKLAYDDPDKTNKKKPINPLLGRYNKEIQSRPSDFKSKYPFTASQCYTIMSGLYKLVGSNDRLTLVDNIDGNDFSKSYQFKNSDLHKELKQHRGYDFTQENGDHLRQVESYIVDRCQRCYHPFRTADTRWQKLSLAIELAEWLKQADEFYRNNSPISNQLICEFHQFIYEPALKLDKKLDNGHLIADKELGKLIEKIGQAHLKNPPDIRQIGEDLFADIQNQSLTITYVHSDQPLQYQFKMIKPHRTSDNQTVLSFFNNNEHDEHNRLLSRIETYIATRIEGNSTPTPEKHYNKLKLAIELANKLYCKDLNPKKFNDIHQEASKLDSESIGYDRFPTKGLGKEIRHIGYTLFQEGYQERINKAQHQEEEFQKIQSYSIAQIG